MRLSKSFVRDSLRSWRAPSLRCVGVYSASRPPPSLLATPLNLKFDADWSAADHKKLLTAHATAPLPEETLSGLAPLRDVSERLAQEECVLRTAVGEVRVEVNRYSAWLDGAEFALAQYRLASRPTVEEKGNLSFVLGGERFRVTCPLFYKLPHVQECVAEALHRRGLGVRAEQVVVTVGDHTMEAEESLQQLDVGAGSVLKVALKGATLVRGTERACEVVLRNTERACEVVLRNTEDVRAFVEQVQASRLYSAQQLTVRIGDAEGCESYTPLGTVLALLGDMTLPRLETLTVVLGVLGVEEDWASCFAAACFPALKELRVYRHEEVEEVKTHEAVEEVKTHEAEMEDDASVLSDAESVQLEKVQSAEAEARKAFSQTINGVAFSFAVSRPDKSQCVVTIEARVGEYAVFFEPGADDLQFTIEHKQKQYKTSVPRDATLKELVRRAVKVYTASRSKR